MDVKLEKKDWEAALKSAEAMIKEGLQIQVHGQLLYNKAKMELNPIEDEEQKAKVDKDNK